MKLQLQAFAHRSHFSALQGSENTTQLARYSPVFYVKPWNKCFPGNSLVTIVTGIALSFQIRILFRLLTQRS